MKFINLFMAFVLTICFFTEVQAAGYGGGGGTSLAIIGGYRQNSMPDPNAAYNRNYRPTYGTQGGLLMYFSISDSIQLRTGAIYTQRDMEFPILTTTGKAKYTYMDIPLEFVITIAQSSFYFVIGEKFGIKTNEACENGFGGTCASNTASPLNILSNFGLGYDLIALGSTGKFIIEANYEFGLNNIFPAFNSNTTGIVANALLKFSL